MQFSSHCFIFIFLFTKTFTFPTDELVLAGGKGGDSAVDFNIASRYRENIGYECGNIFFYDYEVQRALFIGLQRVNQQLDTHIYHGSLYSDAESSEYLLHIIKKIDQDYLSNKYNPRNTFVVFKRDKKEVIDVISRISNNHFTKCIRRDNSQAEQSPSIFESTDGYQCGHDFFGDQTIQESVQLAKKRIGGNTKYPAPYIGRLFPEDSGYLIWPILSRGVMHITGQGDVATPYYLVINKEGDLIDVVAKGFFKNFLRCIRTKQFPTAPKNDPFTKKFVSAPKAGFQCGKHFFDSDYLNRAAETAKMISFKRERSQFPTPYNGDPFNEPCLLWPIFNNGRLYKKARGGSYRAVLTLDFKVISALIIQKDKKIIVCERKITKGKKEHDTSDYLCDNNHFTNQQLVNAAEAGCERIISTTNRHQRFFPARYKGPSFEKEGPYLTFPLYRNGEAGDHKRTSPGHFRVVMNLDCEVVGALTKFKGGGISRNQLFKCAKLKDNLPIEEPSHDKNEPIFEY